MVIIPCGPGHLHGVAWAVASVGDEVHATVAVPFAGVAHVAVAELTVSGVFFFQSGFHLFPLFERK
jgi:hypothetical protein